MGQGRETHRLSRRVPRHRPWRNIRRNERLAAVFGCEPQAALDDGFIVLIAKQIGTLGRASFTTGICPTERTIATDGDGPALATHANTSSVAARPLERQVVQFVCGLAEPRRQFRKKRDLFRPTQAARCAASTAVDQENIQGTHPSTRPMPRKNRRRQELAVRKYCGTLSELYKASNFQLQRALVHDRSKS